MKRTRPRGVEGNTDGRAASPSAWRVGHLLKIKSAGWELFCDRLAVPPLCALGGNAGLESSPKRPDTSELRRLHPEELVTWLDSIRQEGGPVFDQPQVDRQKHSAIPLFKTFLMPSQPASEVCVSGHQAPGR